MGLKDKLDRILTEPYEPALNEYRSVVDAYVIANIFDGKQLQGARGFQHSCLHRVRNSIFNQVYLYPATTTKTAEKDLKRITAIPNPTSVKWNWPLTAEESGKLDIKTGFTKDFLEDHIPVALINQTISHIRLWDVCIERNQPIAILNSNTVLRGDIETLEYIQFRGFVNGVVGLNSLNDETHNNKYLFDQLSRLYNTQAGQNSKLHSTPSVEFADIGITKPQPFPGHAAYLITPWAARRAFEVVQEVGLWPIQFLLCRQLCPWTYLMWPQTIETKQALSPTRKIKR
tara:strand:+ start:652 stop:1512 length:861 start_codon:yes stop_codon:yes gene_type:complete